MELQHKPLIISAGIGGWYAKGIDRMERSLIYHGYAGDMLFWRDEYPPGCPSHSDYPYAFKPYAFAEAFRRGYKVVLWLDASFWAINNPMPIFDYIQDHGLYFFKSGYSLAQTAPDRLLGYGCIEKREDLREVSEFATGAVGINIENPKGQMFFNEWLDAADDGMFAGHRAHNDADSSHLLFLHARQDQSAASMILHNMGIKTAGEDQDYVAYYQTPYNALKCIFFINGI
jgi:hypothetical protein